MPAGRSMLEEQMRTGNRVALIVSGFVLIGSSAFSVAAPQ